MSKQVGDRIRERREELGMTQTDLAKRLGYKSRSTIAKIESNVNSLTMPMVVEFAKVLMVEPSYLMGWEDEEGVRTSGQDTWYTDPETAALAEKLRTNPDYRILFDAVSDISPEDMQIVIDIVKRLGDRD